MPGGNSSIEGQKSGSRLMGVIWLIAALLFCGLLPSAAVFASETITYTYDALGRLTQVQSAGDVNNGEVTSTSYDPAGNRTNQQVTGAGPAPSQLAIGSASATEGAALVFTVTRTGNPSTAVSVDYASAGGTATSGSDFTAASGTLSFAANETSKTITIATIDDTSLESAETMTVSLSGAAGGATIANATGTGTISDNDIGLSIGNATVTEGGALSFTVTRTGLLTSAVSATYNTADGTALAGSDYNEVLNGPVNFAANQATQTITISTLDDSTAESAENMTVTLSAPSGGAVITGATGTGTINDNDQPVSLSVSDASATEGGTVSFTVSLSQAAGSTVTVNYATVDGSAIAGSDFTGASNTLTFAPGEMAKTVTVATADDNYVESAETFTLALSAASGATIADGSGTGTINDNDSASVTFAISDASVTEGGNLTFTVTKSGFTFSTITVNYTTTNGTAIAGSDYTAATGSISFNLAQSSRTITIATINDSVEESAEQMSVILTSASGGTAITDYTGVGTINDDDAPPAPSLSVADTSVTEGGTLSFTVTRSGATSAASTVDYATSNGSAIAGSDYTAASGSLAFAVGETSKTISVTTADDSTFETDETVSIALTNPVGATIATGNAVGTINDNDLAPAQLSISNASVTEGGVLTFTVTRSVTTGTAVGVSYATSDGTATAPGDYTAASGTLSFAVGETVKTVTVTTVDDSSSESAEALTVTLSAPTGDAMIVSATGAGTINDNDAPPTQLSIGDANSTEGSALTFTVTRSGSTSGTSSASYATANGTATAGSDYSAASGTVSFAAGETTKTITVNTTNDTAVEAAETLTVTLSSPVGATINTVTGTGTINDNDIGLAVSNASATEGSALTFTVTRTGVTTGSTNVTYATSNGTATAGTDYTAASGTLTFTAGQTSKTITVNTTADTVGEDNETLTMTLSAPTGGATLLDATGTGTINNDDVTFSVSDATATEGGTLTFTVTKAGQHTGSRSVSYATSNGTATAGSDYTAASGTLSFTNSQSSKTFTVSTTDDAASEASETVTVTLTNPTSGAILADATGIGTITDNDAVVYIQITDNNLAVQSAHQSTYYCQTTAYPEFGVTYQYCSAVAGTYVYQFSFPGGTQAFAPGYSWSNGLRVLSSYYGTSQ